MDKEKKTEQVEKAEKGLDLVMLALILLILVLLFRVALGLHTKAANFTGEIPALPVQQEVPQTEETAAPTA